MKKLGAAMAVVSLVLFAVVAVRAFATENEDISAGIRYKPPYVPIEFQIDSDFNISVSASSKDWVTPLGTLSVASVVTEKVDRNEYLVALDIGNQRAVTYSIRSRQTLKVTVHGSDAVSIAFSDGRAVVTAPRAGRVVVNDTTSDPASSPPTSPAPPDPCPLYADTDRRRLPAASMLIHEWTDGTVKVLICLAPDPMRLFYYGYNRNIDADIMLDATQSGSQFSAVNGDTTYELNGNRLEVRMPNKTLRYDLAKVR